VTKSQVTGPLHAPLGTAEFGSVAGGVGVGGHSEGDPLVLEVTVD